ncbi:hypothetical protein PVAP13_6NG310537 [Panicum virgatum]|uniref:Uncharacterized protein n=1 Tax=Panicum virgatum TaxID=38727 RepID=A0A8T0R2Q6_PANVG|nr:hypothetical protein PVAP13_6NG310537 [Panicum virgatum]
MGHDGVVACGQLAVDRRRQGRTRRGGRHEEGASRPVCLYQRWSWTPRQPSRSVAAAGPARRPGPPRTQARRGTGSRAPGAPDTPRRATTSAACMAASNHWGGGGGGDVSCAGAPGADGDRALTLTGVACLRRVPCPALGMLTRGQPPPCRRGSCGGRPAGRPGCPRGAEWEDAVAM